MTTDHPSPPSPPPATNKEMFSVAMTYAWNWTESFSKTQSNITSVYAVTNAFLFPAYVAALAGRISIASAAVAVVAVGVSLGFLILHQRTTRFVDVGVAALLELEKSLADQLGFDALRLNFNLRPGGRLRRHDTRIAFVAYFVAAAMWSVAAVYALSKT